MTAAGPTSLLQLCVLHGCQTNTPILHPPHPPHLLQPVLGPQPASAPPLHTRTDPPLPSPQRGGQPAWYPGSSGPSAPEDPHPSHRNKSAEPRRPARAPGLAADLPWPRHDPGRLRRRGSPASCTSRIYPSPGEGSPRNASAVPGPAPGFLHRLFRLGEQWSSSLRFLRPSKLCSSLPARSASISQRAKASQSTRSLRVRAQTCPHSVKNLGGRGLGQSLGRGTGRTSRCAQLAARPPPGPTRVSLPEPPHPGNPTRAPTGDPQRKWSLGSALGPNSPHICFPHICPLDPGSHWALPWQCWMLSCQA